MNGELLPIAARGERVLERFYCPLPRENGRLTLEDEEAHHLGRVRRLGIGARVEVFDGRGNAVEAEVVVVGRDRVELTVVRDSLPDRRLPCELTLASAVPKGERFDWLVEKATELGVAQFVPLITERSVVDPREAKLDRLRRRIIEASKQCGRNQLMELARPTRWDELAGAASHLPRLLAHPDGALAPQWPRPARGARVLLAVGPEGGFTPAEIEQARAGGFQVIGLGATYLRIETAGLAGCSVILALCEGQVE